MTDQIAKGTVTLGPDFSQHRITGYVTHAMGKPGVDPNLDVPLISHVKGGLWQGGCFHDVQLPEEFDYVLSLYKWEKYALGPNTTRDEITMYDSLDQGFEQVEELADDVASRLRAGQIVLVHCQAGCNRSGLLAARVLMKRWGLDADAAISLLREQRSPLVLCNDAFEAYLRAL